MSRIKIKKSILVCFLLTSFLVCVFCPLLAQKTYAEESQETSYCNYVYEGAIGNQSIYGQNTGNLCWAFSGTKVVESYLYNKTHVSGTADDSTLWKNFAESWVSLAYMYYVNDTENPDIEYVTSSEGGEYPDKMTYQYNNFGNIYILGRVANTYGLLYEGNAEGQCPLSLTVNCTDSENENYYTKVFDKYKIYADKTTVKNIEFRSIVNYASKSYEHSDKTKEFNEILTRMKDYLKNYGAMSTYVAYTGHTATQESDKYLYYSDTSSETGHALTMIGYDDEKTFTIAGKEYKGAFKTVDSTSNTPSYVWIPYEMYRPAITKIGDNSRENNNILSNTYFIYHLDSCENQWTTNTYVVPANYGSATISTFFDNLLSFFGDNVAVKIITALILIVFVITIIVLLINYTIRKRQTTSANKSAMIRTIADYQEKQVEIERQKQELDAQIQEMRYEAYKKKQRRLKRQFQKKLDEMKNKQDDENKS